MSIALIAADAYEMTAGRTWSLVGGALGLAGVVFGSLAFRRRRGAVVALACGVAGVVMAKGGPGTGYGIVGGYVSLVVGVVAAVLGGLALRRTGARAGARSAG